MQQGFRDMAQRSINAENDFIELVMRAAGCTKSEAEKILRVYRAAKVVKNDIVNGKITVKHGAFWERDVLRNAINQ